jgi:hypothetical protein
MDTFPPQRKKKRMVRQRSPSPLLGPAVTEFEFPVLSVLEAGPGSPCDDDDHNSDEAWVLVDVSLTRGPP